MLHTRLLAVLVLALLGVVPGPAAAQGIAPFDGDPATSERITATDPISAAVEVSQARFPSTAPHAVLATVEAFADSLAGAALSADGPLLLTPSAALDPAVLAELRRVLPAGAGIYVLGGEEAIAPAVEQVLVAESWVPTRLAGQTRVETAVAVADEVLRRTPGTTVLLARSDGPADNPTSAWADSVTGGALAAAAGLPLLVTPTDALHPAVDGWLRANGATRTVLLGGEAALADAVEAAVSGPTRLAGPERTATAAAIADSALWPTGDARRHVLLDGGRADGWAFGLVGAGIAADASAPPLTVVGGVVGPAVRRVVSTCGDPAVDVVLVGLADDAVESTLADMDGGACASEFAELQPFADCQAVLDHFIAEGLARVGPYGLDGYWYGAPIAEPVPAPGPVPVEDDAAGDGGTAPPPPPPAPPPAPSAPGEEGAGGGQDEGVSGTNTQEVGVDEPDIVKTDGRAAYVVTGGDVQVVDLTGGAPALAGTLDLPADRYAHELLLAEDVLVVLSPGDGYAIPAEDAPAGTTVAPRSYYPQPTTLVSRYDVADPLAPALLDAAEYDGSYRSARMVDGVLRMALSANPSGLDFTFPADGSDEAAAAALAHNRSVIEGSSIGDWLPAVDGVPVVACDAVFAPPGFSGITTAVVAAVDVSEGAGPTSAAAVIAQAETLYASPDRLVLTSSRWGVWNDAGPPEQVTTEVHSFDITAPDATRYVASGQVDGWVLNSFSISERDGYLRIATTTEPPWTDAGPGGVTDNGVTVLAEGGTELFEAGRVFGLGLGERIFAVRYLGDIAAVVTFQQVDPLYLVDLTNPAAPRVTGELKIPGVSRYLHPLGEDHLLGVGQDGTDDGRLTGVQVSLFDIGDRAAPTRVDSIEFGPGYSAVEFDHKAFTFWAPLGRAFVPTELSDRDERAAQAIDVDLAAGALTLAGAVAQPTDAYRPIDRTFVANGQVYAVGFGGISAHDLTTLADRGFAAFPGCCDGGGGPGVVDPPPPPPDGG